MPGTVVDVPLAGALGEVVLPVRPERVSPLLSEPSLVSEMALESEPALGSGSESSSASVSALESLSPFESFSEPGSE
jgi:hypothetical protein